MKWVPIVVAIIVIAIWCLPAAWFSGRAEEKGYSRGAWFFITLILGPLGWIISAALVDGSVSSTSARVMALEAKVAEMQKEVASTIAPHLNPSGDWVCKHCGSKNKITDRFCRDCGKYK